MNKEQELIYIKILEILKKYKNIYYSAGFGSFWQDYSNLKMDSDIDFFVLIDNEFSYDELILFYEDIALISNHINYKLSPQIFVGDFKQLFSGTDNILRILTILNKKSKIIEFINYKNLNFYDEKYLKNINMISVIKEQTFKITRFYNRDFKKNISVDLYRYKELINLREATKSYNKFIKFNEKFEKIVKILDNLDYDDAIKFHNKLIELNYYVKFLK